MNFTSSQDLKQNLKHGFADGPMEFRTQEPRKIKIEAMWPSVMAGGAAAQNSGERLPEAVGKGWGNTRAT